MAAAFGLGRKIYERVFSMSDEVTAYVEIAPAP